MKTIHFEDHDQDFLVWTIDEEGTVIDCQPFQLSIWRGHKVINHETLAPGGYVEIESNHSPSGVLTINYPIEKVEDEAVSTKHRNFVP